MATFFLKELLSTRPVVYQQIRFSRNRVNVQRPLPTHFEKEKFLRITFPIHQSDDRHPRDKCLKPEEKILPLELSPLDRIYAEEVRQWFRESKMSAIFARNPMSLEDFHLVRVLLFKANMKIVVRNRRIMTEALGGTEFVNLLPLFDTHNMIAFSNELQITELFRVCRREPRVSLLGAVVDNRILSVSELKTLSAIPDIETARSHLVQTLQMSAQNFHRGLEAHQTQLVHHLQQRVEQLRESQTPEDK